jgi:hypothetical protein
MSNENIIKEIELIQEILIANATGGAKADNENCYSGLRLKLIRNPALKSDLPSFLLDYRNLDQFWIFIKRKFDTYKVRRQFIYEGFAPLLAKLESEQIYPSDENNSEKIKILSADYIDQRWRNALQRRNTDPEAAITSARTLLEDVCKFVLDSKGIAYSENDDLPKLYNSTSQALNLSPAQHTEQIFKEILSGCISTVKGLGSLRNKHSDSHGKGVKHVKPSQRHASLAVNLAGSVATFLLETLEDGKKITFP